MRGRLAVCDVSLRAARAVGAAAGLVGFADWAVDGEADLVGFAQKGREVEIVRSVRMVEDCGGWAGERRGRGGCFGCHRGDGRRLRHNLSMLLL